MLSTDLTPSSAYADEGVSASRLIVTRRDPADETYRAVGYLDRTIDDDAAPVYEFSYLTHVTQQDTFVPIVGFSDLHRHYRSARLFPSFADRVMSAKRPDRPEYLAALDLRADAGAWEILTKSGGHRAGDPIELVSLPGFEPATGKTSACFLAHGVRHRGPQASDHIDTLVPGQHLALEPDPANPINAEAIRIVDGSVHLGFVPDPLVDYVRSVLDGGDYSLTVVQANPAETHPHLRLLLRLAGRCDGFVFDGPGWRAA